MPMQLPSFSLKFLFRSWVKRVLIYLPVLLIGTSVLIWRFDQVQNDLLESQFQKQAEKIDAAFNDITTYTENMMRYISYEIVQNKAFNNPEAIYQSFSKIKNDLTIRSVLSNSGLEWVNRQHLAVVTAKFGILKAPIDFSNRDYIPLTADQPGKLHLGKVVLGKVSHRMVIPAGFGVVDKQHNYQGALTVGFDLERLGEALHHAMMSKGVHASLVDSSLKTAVLVNSGAIGIVDNPSVREWIKGVNFNRNTSTSEMRGSFLRLGTSYYIYRLHDQPYIILLSYQSPISLDEFVTVVWTNASEFMLIILATVIVMYVLYRISSLRASLSQEYFVFALLVTVAATAVMVWLLLSFHRYRADEQKYRYNLEAEKIVATIEDQFGYVENLAKFLSEKIVSLRNYDARSIAKLLAGNGDSDTLNKRDSVFSWSLFDFINKDGQVVASGSQNVLPNPRAVRDRSYLYEAPRRPGKLYPSDPAIGITSGEYVIPAGFGVSNNTTGEYIGTLSMGFNINQLIRKIEGILGSESTRFVVVDRRKDRAILQSSGHSSSLDEEFFKGRLDYIKGAAFDAGVLQEPIEYNGVEYRYFRNMYQYPYTILVGENKDYLTQQFEQEMFPRLIEFGAIWFFILVVLFFFRMKIISPLLSLSQAAEEISRGNVKVNVPHVRSIETSQLARSILYVKRAFLREKRLKHALEHAKEAAENANQSKTDFLTATAHELRSPLNSIIGMANAIRNRMFGNESDKYREYAADIEQAGYELLEFITDLLDINQVEKGSFSLANEEWVDLGNIINRAIKLNVSRASKADIVIHTRIPEALPHVFGDSRRLRQIFVNLISNSIKYSPRGTVITISADMIGTRMSATVEDQGMGMSQEEIAVALKRWSRIHTNIASALDSYGLGLPLTKHLVELHDASFEIESEVGKGTRITVVFPEDRVYR